MKTFRQNKGSIEAAIAVAVLAALFVAGLIVAGAARKVVRERRAGRPSETETQAQRAASAKPATSDQRPAAAPTAQTKTASPSPQDSTSTEATITGRVVPFPSGTPRPATRFSAVPEQTQPRYGGVIPFPQTSISSVPSSGYDRFAPDQSAPIAGNVVAFPTSAIPPTAPQTQEPPQAFVSFLYESLTLAQAQARDERKQYDIGQFANALEAYYFDFKTYPDSLFTLTSAGYIRAVLPVPSLVTGGRSYNDYYYRDSAESYSLCVPLETIQSWVCSAPVQHD